MINILSGTIVPPVVTIAAEFPHKCGLYIRV